MGLSSGIRIANLLAAREPVAGAPRGEVNRHAAGYVAVMAHHGSPRPRGRPQHPDVLTRVEWAILRGVRQGLTNRQIAELRGCREDTVKLHVTSIRDKLGLPDRSALMRWRGQPLPGHGPTGIDLGKIERKLRMTSTSRISAGIVTGVAPMFLVDNVARTAEWYRDHLGFEIGEYFREDHGPHDEDEHHPSLGEPVFVILNRNGHRLMLGRTVSPGRGVGTNRDAKGIACDAYFWVEGVDTLYEQVRSTNTTMEEALATRPYGLREFVVVDCDGRRITFGG